MGREADCTIRWGDLEAEGKAILEASQLILRGPIRRRIPLSALNALSVHAGTLSFTVETMPVALALGESAARAWLQTMQTPPPTLARKLGITPSSKVLVHGTIDAEELTQALAVAKGAAISLILIRASTPHELELGLGATWQTIEAGIPLWVVYPKGKTSTLGETVVRTTLRNLGLIDTKIASISITLTALRFSKPASEK